MFENFVGFLKRVNKKNGLLDSKCNKDEAKERLHLVLMQDRANVSADFLDMMRQEIIDVIKKYIDVDEREIDVRLTNKQNSDGTTGAPALYANIPIKSIKNDSEQIEVVENTEKEETKEQGESQEIVEAKQKKENEEKEVSKEKNEETQHNESGNVEKTEIDNKINNDKKENTNEKKITSKKTSNSKKHGKKKNKKK